MKKDLQTNVKITILLWPDIIGFFLGLQPMGGTNWRISEPEIDKWSFGGVKMHRKGGKIMFLWLRRPRRVVCTLFRALKNFFFQNFVENFSKKYGESASDGGSFADFSWWGSLPIPTCTNPASDISLSTSKPKAKRDFLIKNVYAKNDQVVHNSSPFHGPPATRGLPPS